MISVRALDFYMTKTKEACVMKNSELVPTNVWNSQ